MTHARPAVAPGAWRFVPGLHRLRHYERGWLRPDVVAGVGVAAYLVPQVMAYAAVAGLPPLSGLWAIGVALLLYAVFGSSRQMSVGPESTTALMTAVVVAPLAGGDPARYAALAAALAIVVGVVCLLARAARIGFLSDLLSKPVLVGYMAGIAVLMIVSQLERVTGVPVSGDGVVEELRSFLGGLDRLHGPTALLGASVLVLLLVLHRWLPRVPAPLVGIVAASAAVAAFSLTEHGVRRVGEISAGLPTPGWPPVAIDDLTALVLPALGVAMVGFSDNVLTSRAFADRNHYRVDANQELLALGVVNLGTGLAQGFPVSSSGSRTVIGDALGSRSQLHSLVALATVVLAVTFLGPALGTFPTAALGAIVVFAALSLVDLGEFRRFASFRRSELLLALATTVGVVVLGVLPGVLVAVGLSVAELLRRVARPHDGVLGFVDGLAGMHDVDDHPDARLLPGLVVYRYDSPLFFANAEDFRARALAAVDDAATPTEWFVLNAESNVEVDLTALDALEELRQELARRGVVLAMARVKEDLRVWLEAAGLVDRIGADRVFPTLPTAVAGYRDWYAARHGRPPEG
ncbi:SulP family inorganic anion transporter [Trujillonella endophytica]|uniref:High affinity sulphate transporter 1 n=1 Tax=Trujillonella endophytica TaxID=673521 RepID=A0A1H8QXF4_9ACTN|nr:sulfate permease [Trujillella endophytica]SEO58598.1 high affinity sulphate transporter 1 [Trujillella endophytica]